MRRHLMTAPRGSAEDAVRQGEPSAAGAVEQLERLPATPPRHLCETLPPAAAEREVPELPRHHEAPEHEVVGDTAGTDVDADAHRTVHHVHEALGDRVGEYAFVDGHDARSVGRW